MKPRRVHLTPLDLRKVLKVRAHHQSLCTLNSPLTGDGAADPGSWNQEDHVAGCLGPLA